MQFVSDVNQLLFTCSNGKTMPKGKKALICFVMGSGRDNLKKPLNLEIAFFFFSFTLKHLNMTGT